SDADAAREDPDDRAHARTSGAPAVGTGRHQDHQTPVRHSDHRGSDVLAPPAYVRPCASMVARHPETGGRTDRRGRVKVDGPGSSPDLRLTCDMAGDRVVRLPSALTSLWRAREELIATGAFADARHPWRNVSRRFPSAPARRAAWEYSGVTTGQGYRIGS